MIKFLKIAFIVLIIFFIFIFGIDFYVRQSTKDKIVEKESIKKDYYDCILVLGAGLKNGEPSPVLKDRLDTAIDLYLSGVSSKLIMSGDHGTKEHDEVNVMKNYAINAGVPSEDIFMDHAGFSTYDSVYRADRIFKASKIIVVTQEFHLYRSLYIAKKLKIEAVGVSATKQDYSNRFVFETREILARDKDFVKTIFKPTPKYLGEVIPVSGDGNITND